MANRVRRWNGSQWVTILDAAANDYTALNPVGTVIMWAGSKAAATVPTGWLVCDGSSRSTTGATAALFAVIGYSYGGSAANFNLPQASTGQLAKGIALTAAVRATTTTYSVTGTIPAAAVTGTIPAAAVSGTIPSAAVTGSLSTGGQNTDHSHQYGSGASGAKASGGYSADHIHAANPSLGVGAISLNTAAGSLTSGTTAAGSLTSGTTVAGSLGSGATAHGALEICYLIKL